MKHLLLLSLVFTVPASLASGFVSETWDNTKDYALEKAEQGNPNYWIEQAEQGNAEAQLIVGLAYSKTVFWKQKSFYWVQEAANQNYAPAQFYLALFYKKAYGVEKDQEKAMSLMLEVANKGLAQAEFMFGKWLGEVVENYPSSWKDFPADWNTPSYWMEKAAKQDHSGAQVALAYSYLYGSYDVQQDNVQAYAWAKRARWNDSSYSGEHLSDFTNYKKVSWEITTAAKAKMNDEQLAEAKNRSFELNQYKNNVSNPEIVLDSVATVFVTVVAWKLAKRMFRTNKSIVARNAKAAKKANKRAASVAKKANKRVNSANKQATSASNQATKANDKIINTINKSNPKAAPRTNPVRTQAAPRTNPAQTQAAPKAANKVDDAVDFADDAIQVVKVPGS
ncbi:MAG: tetratricopeptide repeat protein [Bdellovibrionales bacterium]